MVDSFNTYKSNRRMIIIAQNQKDVKVDFNKDYRVVNFGAGDLLEKNTLQQKTVPQSFVLDYKGRESTPAIYIMQCTGGKYDEGRSTGELTLNKFNTAGNRTSIMELRHSHSKTEPIQKDGIWYETGNAKGFGHGSQIGIEYDSNGKTFFWTDINSPVTDTTWTNANLVSSISVFGVQVARFEYTAGRLVKPHSEGIQWLHWRQLGLDPDTSLYSNASLSIDNANKRLAIKYSYCGVMHFAVYDMFYTKEYKDNPIISNIKFVLASKSIAPKFMWWTCDENGKSTNLKTAHTANGWALFGDYIYAGYSTAYFSTNSRLGQKTIFSPTPEDVKNGIYYGDGKKVTKAGNTHIVTYDWKEDMKCVDESLIDTGGNLVYRELEGIFIQPEMEECMVKALNMRFIFAGGETGSRTWSMFENKTEILN